MGVGLGNVLNGNELDYQAPVAQVDRATVS